jgi:hypothetical protein
VSESPGEPSGARGSALAVAAVVAAVVPVVVATVRAVARGWIPLSDNAYFAIRAYDVFTPNIPWLGTWTSASLSVGRTINNPGPMYFDLLAVPVRAFGPSDGVAIGAALLNVAAIVGIAWVAHRRGGLVLLVPAMLATSVLGWTLGSELLFDPWQPHAMLLPFLCFLFVAWGMTDGDLALVPWAVVLGSLLVQTHLSYGFTVPVLAAVGLVGIAWRLRAAQRDGTAEPGAWRGRVARVGSLSIGLGVLCWIQPLVDQVQGFGNLGNLVAVSGGGSGPTLGAARALRVTAGVLSLPPFFLRPSFADTLAPASSATGGPGGVGLAHLPSLGAALVSLAVLVAVLLAVGAWARHRHDRPATAAVVIALVGVAVSVLTALRVPIQVFGVAAHNFRPLWPLAAFMVFAVLATFVPMVAVARRPVVLTAGVVVTALVALVTLPTYRTGLGPALNDWAEPVQRDLDAQLAARPPRGPLLADFTNTAFLEPYSTPLLAQLQRSGVEFVTDDPTQVRQIGTRRRYDGHNARARFVYRLGDAATRIPAGERRVAYHAGLDAGDRRELARLRAADVRSARREALERRWNQQTIGVFVIPLDHRAAGP